MNEIWLTADLHLGHDKNKFGMGGIVHHAKRINPLTLNPFSCIEEHDQFVIDQWNKTVDRKDTVYILGDFAWKDHCHYIMALKGKKILVTGSHDKMTQDAIRSFTEYHEGMLVRAINKIRFVMTHCAMLVWEGSHYDSVNVCGHSHGRIEERDDVRRMDVGIDISNNYTPFNVDFVIYKMSLKKKQEHFRSEAELDAIVKKTKENNIALLAKWQTLKSPNVQQGCP